MATLRLALTGVVVVTLVTLAYVGSKYEIQVRVRSRPAGDARTEGSTAERNSTTGSPHGKTPHRNTHVEWRGSTEGGTQYGERAKGGTDVDTAGKAAVGVDTGAAGIGAGERTAAGIGAGERTAAVRGAGERTTAGIGAGERTAAGKATQKTSEPQKGEELRVPAVRT